MIFPPSGPVTELSAREEAGVNLGKHLTDLKRRNHELDTEIQNELQQRRPNDQLVKCLKRQKLRLKDRIAALGAPQ